MEPRHHAAWADAGGRVFSSANKTIQAWLAVNHGPEPFKAFYVDATSQANALRDGRRPTAFVASLPQRQLGWMCLCPRDRSPTR